jgi:sugar-specific transcriptional regulator TrmB/F0F1-type ATP synthase membrane subunit b/b'
MSLKNVNSSLLKQIGFSEEEQQVYFTILGIGSASLGEISLQTGMPLEELQPIVDELHTRGYLKRIEGKVNRYIAVEPFLKGFLFVEKEFQNDIISIENSLLNVFDTNYEELSLKMEEFKKAIPPIFDKVAEEIRNSNEKLKMDLTESIYRHSDKISNLAEKFDVALTEGFEKVVISVSNELDNLEGNISVILREESDTASERIQKFEQLTQKTIQELLDPLDAALEDFETKVPPEVKETLATNKTEITELQKNIKSLTKDNLKELVNAMKKYESEFETIIADAAKGYSEIVKGYKKEASEIIKEQQEKIQPIVDKLLKTVGNNIDMLSTESTNLKENITELANIGRFQKPSPELVQEALDRANKIDAVAQKIKEEYDQALNTYAKDIIKAIDKLIEENESELAKQEKENSKKIQALTTNLSSDWSKTAKKYEKEVNKSVKDLLKESYPRIKKTIDKTMETIKGKLEELKGKQSKTLAPLRDTIFTDIENILENLYLDSSKRLRVYSESNSKSLENIKDITTNWKYEFKNEMQELLSRPKIIASEMVGDYTSILDDFLTSLNRDQSATLDQIGDAADKFLTELKDSYTTSSNEISNRLAALIYKVNETKTYLQEITSSVDDIVPVPRPHSIIIYGNENSMTAIYDMLLRTRSTCTIVVPTIDQDFAEFLTKRISKRVRIRVLADIDQFQDEALIASLKEPGNITLWQYTMRDFYAVTRDGAEVLLAPITRDGELTSFLTEQDALVRAIQQIINASFMARSKEI